MKVYKKILDAVIKAVTQFLGVLISAIVVIIVLQVFTRYIVKSPLMWTEQTCRFIFIWMMMLGIPCLFHRRDFMAFDLLLESAHGKLYHILRLIIDAFIITFAIFWLSGDIQLIMGTYKKWTTGVRIPYYVLYGVQGISAFLLFNVMFYQFLEQLIAMIKGEDKEKVIADDKADGEVEAK